MDSLIVADIPEIKNPELKQITKDIAHCAMLMQRTFYRVASLLAKVEKEKLYEEDHFYNAADYAQKVFKLKRSDAYNLLKIGKEYTSRAGNGSNLPHEKNDFNKTQVVSMLPLGRDLAGELIESGVITTNSTTREIKEIVKANKQANEVIEGKDDATPDPAEGEGATREDFILWQVTAYRDNSGALEGIETTGEVPEAVANAINAIMAEGEG